MAHHKLTSKEDLEQIGKKNSESLMLKARLANRLAKKSDGRNRRNAYRVKASALYSLVQKLPGRIRISEDVGLTDFVVIALNDDYSGLHLPVMALSVFRQTAQRFA